MRALAVLAALALALAGCSDGKGGRGGGDGEATGAGATPMLHGFVFDPAIRPLEGVVVTVLDTNATAQSDDEGYFGFDALPVEQFLVLVASKDGYAPQSKQVNLVPDTPVRLNFTLEPVAVKAASIDVLPFEGFIGCQLATIAPVTGNMTTDCNMGLEQRPRWDFNVDADLAGAVIEVFWDKRTDAGKSLGMRLETLELGAQNVVLGEVVGEERLRLTVPESAAERYYPQGGIMRLTVYAASDATQNEAGVGESFVVQQAFNAYATLFYVDTPPCYTSFTIEDPCIPLG